MGSCTSGFWFSSLETTLGLAQSASLVPDQVLDTLVAVHDATLQPGRTVVSDLSHIFDHLLLSLCYKYRHHRPCLFANVRWDVVLPEDNDIQVRACVMPVPHSAKWVPVV